MNYIRKTFVELLAPGNKCLIREVKTRDTSKVKTHWMYFGFRFFDILYAVADVDGKKVELTSERINVSLRHCLGNKLYTVGEFKRKFPTTAKLVGGIKSGSKGVVWYGKKGLLVLEKTDIFVKRTA